MEKGSVDLLLVFQKANNACQKMNARSQQSCIYFVFGEGSEISGHILFSFNCYYSSFVSQGSIDSNRKCFFTWI